MKRLIFVVIMLLTLPFVLAKQVYELEDFSKEPIQAIVLEEGDAVTFNLLNGKHAMLVKQISRNNDAIKLNVYPFKKDVTQVPVFNLDNVVKVDLNKDKVNDLALDIDKIEDGRVTLIIKALNTDLSNSELIQYNNENVKQEAPKSQGLVINSVKTEHNYFRTFFVIGFLIVILLGVLVFRRNRSTKEEIDEEKPE